jgi:glycosyltransferase involved in cell wall biosynthesis
MWWTNLQKFRFGRGFLGQCEPTRGIRAGKVIGIHHRLTGLSGHRYTEALASVEECHRRNREVLLFVSRAASPEISQSLQARPVLEDPTFRLDWSFEERTTRFTEMLHSHVTPVVEAGDRVFLTVATQLEANALGRWLRELPAHKKPWIVTVFLSDRWNRHGLAEHERQTAEFRTLGEELNKLSALDNRNLLLFTVSEGLSQEIGRLVGRNVAIVPMPLRYVPLRPDDGKAQLAPPPSPPVVAVLGGMRREKGSHLVPDIFRACNGLVDVRFTIQMLNEGLSPEEFAGIEALAAQPTVTAKMHELSIEEYADALQSADLALFPYEIVPYRQRTSGVFGEAVAYGKPSVVPEGTWLAQQVEEGRATGVICKDLSPTGYARAIAACVSELPQLRSQAQLLAEEWRKNVGMEAFIEVVEQEISRREVQPCFG